MQFLIAMVLGESIAPGYSMHDMAISDLGVIASTRILSNVSLIAFGVLNIVAGYVLFLAGRNRVVFAMFVMAGAGAVGAGLVPSTARSACMESSPSWPSSSSTWRSSWLGGGPRTGSAGSLSAPVSSG